MANKSTYWVKFELTWRDYFVFYAHKYGEKLFFPYGVKGSSQKWRVDSNALRAWKEGRTGAPLVDANMRELRATGFMSNRGRQNVASYLIHDLGLDWRLGAEHFEELLVDYTPESNWGNWHAAAGLSAAASTASTSSSSRRTTTPTWTYVKLWCPELREGAGAVLPHAWLLSAADKDRYGAARLPAAAEDARLQGSPAEEGLRWRPRQDRKRSGARDEWGGRPALAWL